MRNIPTTQEFDAVLKYYGLGQLSCGAERLGGASGNVNFALDTPQGQYFCRVRGGYSEQEALAHSVLAHLTEKGFPTAPLLRTVDGETYVQYNNKIYELHPFLQGEEFERGNHAQFAAMGGVIAKFHKCMQDFECSVPFEHFIGHQFWNNYPHLERQKQFIEITEQDIANMEGPAELRERIGEALMQTRHAMEKVTSTWELIELQLPHAFVHGDYHPLNVQFQGNEVAFVCDFDFVMPAERIYDIITAFVWWMQEGYGTIPEGGENAPPDISYLAPYREFLASYNAQSTQMLTSEEMQALIPDMQRLLLLYGSKASMHYDNFEGMLNWLITHLRRVEWLERYKVEFERGLFQ